MTTFHLNAPPRRLALLCALVALTALSPASAAAANSTTAEKHLGLSVPASARTSTTGTSTTTPTTTTATPASGAQPGTVPPGATPTTATPTTSVPTTTTPPSTTPTVTTPATTTPSATTPTTATPGTPTVVGVSRKTSPSTHLSTGALALAILGALLALGCAMWVVGRWLALEPRWTVSLMHSLREATYHASSTWAEFSDWAKLGH
ncbi:MAG: hypothetical protein ACRDJ3_05950 [Solirubrobacteraceae bacterium]